MIAKLYYKGENPDRAVIERFLRLPMKKLLFIEDEKLYEELTLHVRTILIPKGAPNVFVAADDELKLKELKQIINQ